MGAELSITINNCHENYECKNLSYHSISNLNFNDIPYQVSFYRSDFRGSSFDSDVFINNNFDLADFIGNTFKNVEFHSVNFGASEFKNGFFYHCLFEDNNYKDIAVHGCTFTNCVFQNEQFRMTMINCTFINCQFIDCIFDQCSTDTLSFKKCVFLKCELSTMHAENFKFEKCTFRDAFLGICFLGTYLFKDTDINLIRFKYRGEEIGISSSDYFTNFVKTLLEERRFFEYFNLSLLWGSDSNIPEIDFPALIHSIIGETNPNVREYNIGGVFDTIEFYCGADCLPLKYVLDYAACLHSVTVSSIPSESQLFFLQRLYRLDAVISSLNIPLSYFSTLPSDITCIATFHCNDTSPQSAERHINELLNEINRTYFNGTFEKPYFDVISCREGSIFLTITSSLLLVLMTAKVIRSVAKLVCDIRIEAAKTKKTIELIGSSKSTTTLSKVLSCLPTEKDTLPAEKIHNILGIDYLQDIVINYFLK